MNSIERLKEFERMSQNRQQRATVPRYQQDFQKAYGEATNYNQDLISQRADTIGQAQALPAQLREQYASSSIRNPLAQEALIAQRRGGLTSDITRLSDLLGARQSRYEDVLRSHTQGYTADLEVEDREIENAWRLYQDILAQEEAERSRRAAAANAFDPRSLFDFGDDGFNETGGEQPELAIEVDPRSIGTRTIDRGIGLDRRLDSMFSSIPGIKNVYGAFKETPFAQRGGQKIQDMFQNFLSTPLGKRYAGQSKFRDMLKNF